MRTKSHTPVIELISDENPSVDPEVAKQVGQEILENRLDPATWATALSASGGKRQEALAATAPLRAMHIGDDGAVREARARFGTTAPRLVIDNALDRMAADLEQGAFPVVDFATARSLVGSDADEDFGFVPVVLDLDEPGGFVSLDLPEPVADLAMPEISEIGRAHV